MKRMFRFLLISLCCAAAAQTTNSSARKPMKTSSLVSLTGCLSGPNHEGVYVLETGSEIVDVGGLHELNDHVGHKVKLVGKWAKSGAEIGEKDPSENKETEQRDRVKEKWFRVSKIHMMSRRCDPKQLPVTRPK
jgi:hypothetical protein